MNIQLFTNKEEWVQASAKGIVDSLSLNMQKDSIASLAVSGGSTPFPIYSSLQNYKIDWSKVTLIEVDERFVPVQSPESNWSHITSSLEGISFHKTLYFKYNQDIYRMQQRVEEELPDTIDVMVLGMGLDGHFASLFPGGEYWNHTHDTKTLITQAPDGYLTPQRLSLSPEYIHKTDHIVVLISGKEKYEYLIAHLEQDNSISQFPFQYLKNHPHIEVYCYLP